MSEQQTKNNDHFVRIRPETRKKFEHVRKVKRWKFIEVADAAVDALLQTDPELRKAKVSA